MFDASHGEQFDMDDAQNGLKLVCDMVNASTRFVVRINYDAPLDESTLNGVDVLVIADPDVSNPFGESEFSGIAEMLANGSSLFLLGDPAISQESEYWDEALMQDMGDNLAMNRLMDGINMTGVRFSVNETNTDVWSDTMFDYTRALNDTYPWMMRFDAEAWDSTHPIFRNINELFIMTATLKPVDLPSGIASGYDTTFAQYRDGPLSWANYSFPNMTLDAFEEAPLSYSAINGTFPSWLSAFTFGESRVVVAGSTIMFTGRTIDMPEADLTWFSAGDNARLFFNIIDWLSYGFVQAPGAIEPILIISTVILAVGAAYYLLKKIR
ncbi:MAG: hypothetical protein ACP6KW_07790 [Candidatus Thorarchaeota archaeon]